MKKIAVALLLFGLAACAGPYDSMYGSDKMKFKDGVYEYEGNTVRFSAPELTVEASYLSPEGLDLYFSLYKGGEYKNPFPPGGYMVFSLSLENKSKKSLTYNPRATLLLEKDQPVHPKDFASLYAELEFVGADDVQGRMEAFRVSCLDTTVTVFPGEKAEGLLVFPRKKEARGEEAKLVVDSLYLGHEPRTVPLSFGKQGKGGKD